MEHRAHLPPSRVLQGDAQTRVIDADRVDTLLDGARRYAATAGVADAPSEGSRPGGSSAAGAALVGGSEYYDVGRAADVILDLLAEDTPVSQLVTEQLVLVLAAGTRSLWAELRARSGRLPSELQPGLGSGSSDAAEPGKAGSGRSVLGALVDPLGIFRNSALVDVDQRDRAALAAASKLVAVAMESGALPPRLNPSEPLPTSELRRLAQVLSQKVWERREALPDISRRLLAEALDQTSRRLDRRRPTRE